MGSLSVWHILIAGVVLFILYSILRPARRPATSASSSSVVADDAIGHGDGDFEQEVHGESHYQAALQEIAGAPSKHGKEYECEALLEVEPTNRYDSNAVRVTIAGKLVGYLPRDSAAVFSSWCRSRDSVGLRCRAMIVGGWDDGETKGSYGVRLDVRIG